MAIFSRAAHPYTYFCFLARCALSYIYIYISRCLRPTTATALGLGMVGMWLYTKRTLPDYLHRPYIFRRGQLTHFLLPWEVFSHGTLPDYLHRPYIFRRGQLSRFFWLGSLGSFSHGSVPDYLHRPYIFRRGQLTRFLFWIPWEVFHTVLCQKTATEDGGNVGIY